MGFSIAMILTVIVCFSFILVGHNFSLTFSRCASVEFSCLVLQLGISET